MKKSRLPLTLLAVGAAIISALTLARPISAGEDEESLSTISAAKVSRDAAGNVLIDIAPSAQREIEVATETLNSVVRPVELEAYGYVLDPAPLSKLSADVLSTRAALNASQAQFVRSRRLFAEQKNVSLRDLQAAEASYLADRARLESLEQELRDTWGSEIAGMDSRRRYDLVTALIDRREAMVRISIPAGETLDHLSTTARVIVLGHEDAPVAPLSIDYAPSIDERLQGQSFLLVLRPEGFVVRPGMAVSTFLPRAASQQGVIVPRSAVVRYAGKEWLYRVLNDHQFTRQEIAAAQITSDGYFITTGLRPGMRIVVAGAQALLSEELKAQIQTED